MIVTTTPAEFEKKILLSCIKELNYIFKSKISVITTEVKEEVKLVMMDDTFRSLVSGDLKGHFGIPAGEEYYRATTIIQEVINSVNVTFRQLSIRTNRIVGGITISILKKNMDNLLSLSAGFVNDAKNSLHWLEWLLVRGDEIIVSDFEVDFGSFPYSRSGDAVMIKQIGSYWRVPSQFSGTINDNFITRALSNLEKPIFNVLKKNLQ